MDLKEYIQTLKSSLDIVTIIGSSILLQKSGHTYRALCPFHAEKTPSFYVYPENQRFHCFGCGASGDVIEFVSKYENLGFMDALRLLAKDAHLPPPPFREEDPALRRHVQLLSALIDYYAQRLEGSADGRRYLQRRKISQEDAKKFSLGFVDQPRLPSDLQKKCAPEDWRKLGILQADGTQKFFRRLIFPIHDRFGRPLGVAGRLVEENEGVAKYVNSPQGPFFNKKNLLYLEHLAGPVIEEVGFSVVVEGYMDAIRLHQNGFGNTVAVMGTALNAGHFRRLKRYSEKIVLLFDSDRAGREAVFHSFQNMMPGINVKVVQLPGAKDPDEFLSTQGAVVFREKLRAALPIEIFLSEQILKGFDISSVSGKEAFLQKEKTILRTLQKLGSVVRLDALFAFIAGKIGISKEKCEEWWALQGEKKEAVPERIPPHPQKKPSQKEIYVAEDGLIIFLLVKPSLKPRIRQLFSLWPEGFSPLYVPFFKGIMESNPEQNVVAAMGKWLEKEIQDRIFRQLELSEEGYYENAEWLFVDYARKLWAQSLKVRKEELDHKIQMEKEGKQRDAFIQKRNDLNREVFQVPDFISKGGH